MKYKILVSFQVLLIISFIGISVSQKESKSDEISIIDEQWGLFKPHLLFCITQKSLNPLNFGIMYTNYNKQGKKMNPRYFLRSKFGNSKDNVFIDYKSNNGQDFAEQRIVDDEMQIDIQISFIKNEEQQWGVNLKINNKQKYLDGLNVYLYLSASSYEKRQVYRKVMNIEQHQANKPIKLEIDHLKKKTPSDYLEIQQQQGEQSQIELKLLQRDLDYTWKIQDILLENLDHEGKLQNPIKISKENIEEEEEDSSSNCNNVSGGTIRRCERTNNSKKQKSYDNIALIRIFDIKQSESNFFIRFNNSTLLQQSQRQTEESSATPQQSKQETSNMLDDFESFERVLKAKKNKFKLKLKQKFGYEKEDLIQSVISNLLGGIVFYHGQITVRNSLMKNEEYRTVFSASPSRLLFPRAFLWDEGFHDTIICIWNEQLCKQFLHSWLQNQDIFGYISREQVRTTEIYSMVPDGFRSQDAYEANPPTLLFPILQITSGRRNIQFLKKEFRKLEKWFKWFIKTQSGLDFHNRNQINRIMFNQNLQPHYRWQCKGFCNDGNFMGSGLDDYPRQDLFIISKQHLDLQSWIIFFAESLETLSLRLNDKVKHAQYGQYKNQLIQQLMNEFLDHKSHSFKDIGANQFNHTHEQYVNHIGYITLFPLIFNTIPLNSTELFVTLDLLYSREHLWSDFGIRSLSLKDPLFGTGDNYWRGAIWMPLNYLILRSLKLNYFQNERVKTIYHELRDNLIQNIYKNWKQSGYLYETYHPSTGQGQRGHPFNGWTSLIVLIIKQQYE